MDSLLYHPCQPGYYKSGKKYMELGYSEDCNLGQYVCQMFEVYKPDGKPVCIIPDACNDIIIQFDGENVKSWLSPSVKETMEFQFTKVEWIFGVRFYPGATCSIFNNCVSYDVTNPILMTDLIPEFKIYEAQLKSSKSFVRRHEIMEEFLTKTILRNSAVSNILTYCVRRLIATNGLISIDELSESAGYSSRYIRQLFTAHVGHSTKEVANIIRLQKTLNYMLEHPDEKLGDIAVKFDFSDHSHMNREFRRFLGVTSSKIKENERWNSVLKSELNRIF